MILGKLISISKSQHGRNQFCPQVWIIPELTIPPLPFCFFVPELNSCKFNFCSKTIISAIVANVACIENRPCGQFSPALHNALICQQLLFPWHCGTSIFCRQFILQQTISITIATVLQIAGVVWNKWFGLKVLGYQFYQFILNYTQKIYQPWNCFNEFN